METGSEQFIQLSQDGSHTVFSNKYNAHYHSIYGAIEESIHVFISAGLYFLYRKGHKHVSIFEMGFGTALNAILTILEADRLGLSVSYTSIESDPVTPEIYKSLNYSQLLNLSEEKRSKFELLHTSPWNTEVAISDNFKLLKIQDHIENMELKSRYDLIYFDAFAPSCQAELWNEALHIDLYNSLQKPGLLATYCTQGAFKRTLKKIGYQIDILDGPGKKREMLRALKL
ncbi:MAG: tRNA (5-methylaminomethyl-2-thiouridine)(34)-methyltransferase MnmD [Bacteroidia bacterium]|nr:tRNA (5-methylaminomethyl-2-thiouridine)(34)-methyltransferase MnmD [Bacteroidia bacterium]